MRNQRSITARSASRSVSSMMGLRTKNSVLIFLFAALFAGSSTAHASDAETRRLLSPEEFAKFFKISVFPAPLKKVIRWKGSIRIGLSGEIDKDVKEYIDSAILELSMVFPYKIEIIKKGNVNNIILSTDNIERDALGKLRKVIVAALPRNTDVEKKVKNRVHRSCYFNGSASSDEINGSVMILSNDRGDKKEVKKCIYESLLTLVGVFGPKIRNKNGLGNKFYLDPNYKKLISLLYSNKIKNGQAMQEVLDILVGEKT